jgi:hypothetical protein
MMRVILTGMLLVMSCQLWSQPIGTVSYSKGEVSVFRDTVLLPRAVDDQLELLDRVVTGADGKFSGRLLDGSVIMLGVKSDFQFREYNWSEDATEASAVLDFFKGAFRAITGAIEEVPDRDFVVRTPVATIGIRGTDFWGGFIFGEQLDVTVLEGRGVYVEARAGKVELDLGEGTTVNLVDRKPTPPKKWPEEKLQRAIASVTLD